MARTYTNYRWVPSNVRKGDRYYYKRDMLYVFPGMQSRKPEEQVVATVTYDADAKSPHWGKWHANIHPQSPELNALRQSDIPKFASKDDAIAWTTAMVRLSL
jgi:hypothetical protein